MDIFQISTLIRTASPHQFTPRLNLERTVVTGLRVIHGVAIFFILFVPDEFLQAHVHTFQIESLHTGEIKERLQHVAADLGCTRIARDPEGITST